MIGFFGYKEKFYPDNKEGNYTNAVMVVNGGFLKEFNGSTAKETTMKTTTKTTTKTSTKTTTKTTTKTITKTITKKLLENAIFLRKTYLQ